MSGKGAFWLSESSIDLNELAALTAQATNPADVPRALGIEAGVPVYDGKAARQDARDPQLRRSLMQEWGQVFQSGAGVLLIRNGVDDLDALDAVSNQFRALLEEEKENSLGDHFSPAGINGRIWNVHEKLCIREPALFVRYFANPVIRMLCEAWLGPMYQVTAQVNLVYPGGRAQDPHRDYHLGFQHPDRLTAFPAHVHRLSQALTLQGAIAHCDMPLESGPTMLLPHSQKWLPGYLATTKPEVREHFAAHHVQVPLQRGDVLFFNPALIHAAGENRTPDIERLGNLLQVGSAFGRVMEILDRARMCRAIYPSLLEMNRVEVENRLDIESVIAAVGEGYAFPSNLELEPPAAGMHVDSQQDILRQALAEQWAPARFDDAISTKAGLNRSH